MESKEKDGETKDGSEKEEEKKTDEAANVEMSFEEAMALEMESSSSDSEDEGMGLMDRAKEMLREQQMAFIKAFIDYGPPYYFQAAKYELINECSEQKQKVLTVHSLLNARYNPNLRDPEDLYYTAAHWCARNCHLMSLRMLYRAKANFNLTNEFGQTVLHMACIVQQPMDKRKNQKKMVEYLVTECGVDVNVIDKGGFAAIDYSCMNDLYDIIKILIRGGSHVLRNNETLVAKRKDLLDHITDPDCYRIVFKAVKLATDEYEKKSAIRKAEKDERDRRARFLKRQEEMVVRKVKQMEAKKKAAAEAYKAAKKKARDDRIRKEMNTLTNIDAGPPKGGYIRDKHGKWHFVEKGWKKPSEVVYAEARRDMKDLRRRHKYEVFNERWNAITGGELEMEWRMSNAYDVEGLSDEEKIEDVEEEKSEYDENDEELQDMDLDDVLFT